MLLSHFRRFHAPILGLLLVPLAASALDIQVSKTEDSLDGVCDVDCSLREAVVLANSTPGANRISLGAATYSLTLPTPRDSEGFDILEEDANLNGDLDITGTLEIIGAGAEQTLIDGNNNDRIFEVLRGARLVLRNLTLLDGRTSAAGGALQNHGHSLLHHVHLRANKATHPFSRGGGGAIDNQGMLEVYWANFQGNYTSFGDSGLALGGALFNQGELLVRDSLFNSNFTSGDDVVALGGALFNIGVADVARSSFLYHSANGPGATIRNDGSGVLKLTNVTVSGNSFSSASDNDAAVANGSYYPMYAGVPSMQLINVTIASNQTLGLLNYGTLLIRNSLIAGNTGYYEENLNCLNGGDGYTYQARGLLLGNGPGNCTADLYIENADTFTRLLYPLASNNSTLPSHALRKGSLAVDAGIGSCTAHDQRRLTRPRDGDGDGVARCDLGAYERAKP